MGWFLPAADLAGLASALAAPCGLTCTSGLSPTMGGVDGGVADWARAVAEQTTARNATAGLNASLISDHSSQVSERAGRRPTGEPGIGLGFKPVRPDLPSSKRPCPTCKKSALSFCGPLAHTRRLHCRG